ncbi:hypothetical protein [Streptomyces sp. 351MFTsu5.1]|uniref:hypothetical protein n=1 Tax=Streptomyces sp. 351MFTsu5.1 TaxID=1172180 RepID=UPI000380FE0E|nr:hypothetical protein [Streptomyces sp. 351MFTsu5.1]
MNGWHDWNGYDSGSAAEHGPSEERGRAAWNSGETRAGERPPWASAETRAGERPPWASAETQTSFVPPRGQEVTPPWSAAPTQVSPVSPGWGAGPPTPSWTSPAPAPAGPASHRVGRVFAALAVAVLVGVAVGAGVWFLLRDTSLGSRSGAVPAPSVTADSSSAKEPSHSASSPSPPPSSAPDSGYRRTLDPVGYTLEVPRGWTRTEKQGQAAPVVAYENPADGRRLQIFRLAEDTPARSLDLAENDPGYGFARQPGYQVLDRASGATWSELAYRYDDPDLGARQVVDHRFEAADGTLYAIRATGPAALASAEVREPLTRALSSFCPTGTQCG